jgi:hypothetical protein
MILRYSNKELLIYSQDREIKDCMTELNWSDEFDCMRLIDRERRVDPGSKKIGPDDLYSLISSLIGFGN